MYKQLKEYTSFIKKASENPSKDLSAYHEAMLKNFQHERLIHLIITFFFVSISILGVILSCVLSFTLPADTLIYLIPLFVITFLLIALSIAYVIHYYHLENGIQKLYKFSEKLYKKKP